MSAFWTFAVDRDDLAETTLLTSDVPTLGDAEVLLKVDRVGLTANNVTYALLGATAFRYWDFFPTEPGLGVVPLWGFADVIESNSTGVEVGARVYGYLPSASHLVVRPGRGDGGGFSAADPHRVDLPSPYNAYAFTTTDRSYSAADEDMHVLFRPLFWTSFMLADQIEDQEYYGADRLLISSASSKTAYGTAEILHGEGCDLIGLTSPGNVEFTESLGCYDMVVAYDKLDRLDASIASAYVDFAGSSDTTADLRGRFGSKLMREVIVGVTHQQLAGADALGGQRTTVFFAPDQIRKRAQEWGRAGLDDYFAAAWNKFAPRAHEWVDVVEDHGPDDLRAVWLAVLGGTSQPRIGHVLSL